MTGQTGSYMYMAPEVFNSKPYNEKADVFSFGCMISEMFRGYMLSSVVTEGTGNTEATIIHARKVGAFSWQWCACSLVPKVVKYSSIFDCRERCDDIKPARYCNQLQSHKQFSQPNKRNHGRPCYAALQPTTNQAQLKRNAETCPYSDLLVQVAGGYRHPVPKGLPSALKDLINSCLAQEPEARPSMADVKSRLDVIESSGVLEAIDSSNQETFVVCRRCVLM